MHRWEAEAIMNSPEKRELVEAIQKTELDYKLEQERLKIGYVELFAVKVSEDHGKTWKTQNLCQWCIDQFEPPTRLRNVGGTGAYRCEGSACGGKFNEIFKKGE